MDKGLAVSLTAIVGGLVALQAPINSGLGKAIGTWQAALFSFILGTIILIGIVSFSKGSFGSFGEVRSVSWYYLIGGIFGAAYVVTVLVTVRSLGAGGVTAATIAGQLSMAVVIDHFGFFGVERAPITFMRIVGVVLLVAGTFIIIREHKTSEKANSKARRDVQIVNNNALLDKPAPDNAH